MHSEREQFETIAKGVNSQQEAPQGAHREGSRVTKQQGESWWNIFYEHIQARNEAMLEVNKEQQLRTFGIPSDTQEWRRWQRVSDDFQQRGIRMQHTSARVKIARVHPYGDKMEVYYRLQYRWDVVQRHKTYRQCWAEDRLCVLSSNGDRILHDQCLPTEGAGSFSNDTLAVKDTDFFIANPNERRSYYDREKAVAYAHRWWNDANPEFRHFDVDCTNYVSQCLHAGGAPMKHSSDRAKGWWYRYEPVNWSFSWAVAHSLRWFLPSSTSGLRGEEVSAADQLQPGDVICYDFNGNGQWQHTTFVVDHDAAGKPLVNAHTSDSQNRYWDYRDSYAWTDDTAYRFFRIVDRF